MSTELGGIVNAAYEHSEDININLNNNDTGYKTDEVEGKMREKQDENGLKIECYESIKGTPSIASNKTNEYEILNPFTKPDSVEGTKALMSTNGNIPEIVTKQDSKVLKINNVCQDIEMGSHLIAVRENKTLLMNKGRSYDNKCPKENSDNCQIWLKADIEKTELDLENNKKDAEKNRVDPKVTTEFNRINDKTSMMNYNLEDDHTKLTTEREVISNHETEPQNQVDSTNYVKETTEENISKNNHESNFENNRSVDIKYDEIDSDGTNCNSLVFESPIKYAGDINVTIKNYDKVSQSLCNLNQALSENNLESGRYSWRRSVNEKHNNLSKTTKEVSNMKESQGLTRSDYSLVSCSELTTGQIWLSLPEEVKGDPAFEALRQLYESERSKETIPLTLKNSTSRPKRLPLVNSAPHLNNNVLMAEDGIHKIDFPSNEKERDDINLKCSSDEERQKQSKLAQARHYTKMTILLACWVFFTVVFLMYSEKEVITRNTAVTSEVKSYVLNKSDPQLSILLQLQGPFLPEQNERKLNTTQLAAADKMEVWLERWRMKPDVKSYVGEEDIELREPSPKWSLVLQSREEIDFNEGEPRSKVLKLGPHLSNTSVVYAIQMKTDSNVTIPLSLSYTVSPLDIQSGVIYACILLTGLYILIIFEVINRTMAAVIVSTTSVAVLALVGERPSLAELISWLDVETLLLLFSMMLLVAIMAETGMFDFLAVFTFEVTKGKLWPLITLLCAITALLSTFLDNVTTVLLMTPVTIRLCEVMELDPVPILMSMVLFSNIGGTMTPVGDPPNVIIASNKAVIQSGVNFTNFTIHMSLGIILVCLQTYYQLRFIYRDTSKLRLKVPKDIQELTHQISIWRRAADSLPHLSKDEQVVRERLERKIRKLNVQLETRMKENSKRACPKSTFQGALQDMKDKYKIRDKVLLVKASVAIVFVVAVFFLHSIPEFNRVSLGWTALLGAILLLTLADREDLEPILHRVEWSTLLFFAALFVLMEALSKLGLIQYIGGLTESLILKVDESARLAAAIILLLWVSGLTSAFVDNIPLTTMMVRIVTSLGSNPNLNLPMTPLVWALAFGACLGGNGTLIGASANVVCAGVAEQYGYKFSFMQFLKIGFPIMIGHLIVASAYLLICHCAFTWH